MSSDLALQLKDYRLTTAEITYRMPDHQHLLQEFIWQNLDIAPRYPVLNKFLEFWRKNLDAPLFRVRVESTSIIQPVQYRFVGAPLLLH